MPGKGNPWRHQIATAVVEEYVDAWYVPAGAGLSAHAKTYEANVCAEAVRQGPPNHRLSKARNQQRKSKPSKVGASRQHVIDVEISFETMPRLRLKGAIQTVSHFGCHCEGPIPPTCAQWEGHYLVGFCGESFLRNVTRRSTSCSKVRARTLHLLMSSPVLHMSDRMADKSGAWLGWLCTSSQIFRTNRQCVLARSENLNMDWPSCGHKPHSPIGFLLVHQWYEGHPVCRNPCDAQFPCKGSTRHSARKRKVVLGLSVQVCL